MPHINAEGLALIEDYEGLSLDAYPDPGTGGEPHTIGYGHTGGVKPGDSITKDQAVAFLRSDVAAAEKQVAACVEVTLTSNQFSALVSFQFNTGSLGDSTLLSCVNEEDWYGAKEQFGRWVHAGGRTLAGLVRRRAAEAALFMKGLAI